MRDLACGILDYMGSLLALEAVRCPIVEIHRSRIVGWATVSPVQAITTEG